MKRFFSALCALTILFALSFSALASDEYLQPSEDFYVNDQAGTLSESTKELIDNASGPEVYKRQDTSGIVADVIPIFLIGLVFYAFSRITTSGFYATEKALYSYLCVYAEPILLLALLLVLPVFFGQEGVWWSVVLSQVLTAMLAFVLKTDVDRRERIKHGIK